MSAHVTQIKVSLPDPLYDYLHSKAGKFGLTLSSYVKNLIIDDVKDIDYPIYQASNKIEKSYKKALQERNQATEVGDVDEYFETL
ncbi:MAG: hypothetical protein AAB612_02220 [Patescibacteria group bacterium]